MEIEQHREQIISNLSIVQKYLYSSSYSGNVLYKIAIKHQLESKYYTFAITIGDIILGFYKIEDTVPLLQQELGLDPKTAALLGAEVLEFLAPLSDPNWQPPVEADEGEETATFSEPESVPTRIPVKAPAVFGAEVAPVALSANTSVASTQYIPPTPEPTYTPQPLPVQSYAATVVLPPVPQAPTNPPLSSIPSYTPPQTPPPTSPTPPAPDRPRWSTDI